MRDAEGEFLSWLERHGADVSKLVWPVADGFGGRTAYTAQAIAAGEPFLRVPEELMITATKALASDLGPMALTAKVSGDALLAVFVMWEQRKPDSFWAPYFAILPESDSLALWPAGQLAMLRDDDLVQRCRAEETMVDDIYLRVFTRGLRVLYPKLFDDYYSRDRFGFAWRVVQARAFGRKLTESALVPWADCLNHGGDSSYEMTDDFVLFPSSDVPKNAEALNTYGKKANNAKLLLDYGFALDANPHDRLRVPISLEDDSLLERKRRVLNRNRAPHFAFLTLSLDSPLTLPANFSALTLLRVAAADEAALEQFERVDDDTCGPHHVFGDVDALGRLVDELDRMAVCDDGKKDKDAIVECRRALDDDDLPHCQRRRVARTLFALRYRTTRADILRASLAFVRDALDEARQADDRHSRLLDTTADALANKVSLQ